MVDILHRIGAEASTVDEAFAALSTIDGLAGWWASDTTGESRVGGTIHFTFAPGEIDMEVKELVPGKVVRWEVVGGPPEWIGTEVVFELRQEGNFAIVLFEHRGWAAPVEFMYHCSTKWATFLVSLKQLLETGTGAPEPVDLRISDWH
jgi:uncharacterized protein YndB with AHSA1/START domain